MVLDPRTGEEIWRTKLPHSTGTIVTVLIKGRCVYVGLAGHVYCLDQGTGDILWKNGLPKMGYHPVIMAMEGAQGGGADPATAKADQQRRAAAAGATGGGAYG